jgi:hypothetical protein
VLDKAKAVANAMVFNFMVVSSVLLLVTKHGCGAHSFYA